MQLKAFLSCVGARFSRHATLAVALAAVGFFAGAAQAQMAANTARAVRPLVWVRDISSANATQTALGLFDTGAIGTFVPPPTNSVWNIAPNAITKAAGQDAPNYNTVGVPTSFNVGGLMGGAFNGPQVGAPPSHIFTSVSSIANTSLAGRINIAPSLTYYNNRVSFVNIGASFYNGSTAGAPPYVAEIDPTNSTFAAFPFNSITAGTKTQTGVALISPFTPTDQASSSVSLYFAGTAATPTPAANADPGFLTVLPLNAVNIAGTQSAANTFINITGTNGATQGFRPAFTTPTPSPVPGLTAGTTYVADTGAATTGTALGGGQILLGTDILNGYGQYFDFANNNLMLFGPTNPVDRNIVGPGILFTVDRSTTGLPATGVNQMATNGSIPVNNAGSSTPPGGTGGVAIPGDGITGQQSSAIYRTQLTHSNASYVSGTAALNLAANDQMDGLSMGVDQPGIPTEGVLIAGSTVSAGAKTSAAATPISIASPAAGLPGPDNCELFFSVDQNSQGKPGSGVAAQAALGKVSSNMYLAPNPNFIDTGRLGETNVLRYSGDLLGLGPNAGPTTAAAGRGHVDHLGDFVLESQRGYYTTPASVPGAFNAATVQRNTDPMITSATATPFNPGAGVPVSGAVASSPAVTARGDNLGSTFNTYFSLDSLSPTLAKNGNSAADILVNKPTGTGYNTFATAAMMGLNNKDDLDSLTLSLTSFGKNSAANPVTPGKPNVSPSLIGNFDDNLFGDFQGVDSFNGGTSDYDLFTLARGSPDLSIMDPVIGRDLSAADVFVSDFDGTFALYSTAESLGLNPATDEITGLKPLPQSDIPEPSMVAVLAVGAVAMMRRGRRDRLRKLRS
jgi:hypothetical protein